VLKTLDPTFPHDDRDWFDKHDRNHRIRETPGGFAIVNRDGQKILVSAAEFIRALEAGLEALYK
jgi:hypothetical protein